MKYLDYLKHSSGSVSDIVARSVSVRRKIPRAVSVELVFPTRWLYQVARKLCRFFLHGVFHGGRNRPREFQRRAIQLDTRRNLPRGKTTPGYLIKRSARSCAGFIAVRRINGNWKRVLALSMNYRVSEDIVSHGRTFGTPHKCAQSIHETFCEWLSRSEFSLYTVAAKCISKYIDVFIVELTC